MSRSSLVLALSLIASSCSSVPVPSGEQIGEPVRGQEVVSLSVVQSNPLDYFEKTLLVEGKIVAVCQKKGCWMQIEAGGEPTRVRWYTDCGGKYSFPKDAAGERVIVQGSFYSKEYDEAFREHMKEEAGNAGKNLKIPAKGFEMNATAVVLLDRVKEAAKN